MIEFAFLAAILMSDGQHAMGFFKSEAECRQEVETAQKLPTVSAVSPCVKVQFQRVFQGPKT